MSAETYTSTPKKFFAGSDPDIITAEGTLVSGQILEAGTLLVADKSTGKLSAHPGNTTGFIAATSGGGVTVEIDTTPPVAGILMYAYNASTGTVNNAGNTVAAGTAADLAVQYYKGGNFFASQLVFKQNGNGSAAGSDMAATSTDILKQKLVNGSLIALTFQATGEV
jgi:hypothetical protein